ncbi:leucine-rich single-pass membrane protein 1 [Hemicordylus capensis]|uniref:leucine-rich single-pass membrane protein 1 n=1 Tax=Hemicordylus capensis TaxID=884348 RepID=UPI00230306CF|nr:leucine-rich single-pass membrane protein 1 [Hemicordylus capensis]XP_053107805.1 leucine-rich single-pass membrane protein 1 [Hemicordylus capensis]XP_053107807.1 leucine-rich single-pass membrane protein 1 [Hemicordylus capensis]
MMENSSFGNDSHDERKLYAVDSLNNLNEQRLCVARSHYQTVWEENSDSDGCLAMQSSMKCPSWFFVTLIITLIVSLALVSFVIILIVHTGDKMDEVSKKIVQERKSIEDLQKLNDMILQYLNQTDWMENIGNLSTV